ncbi:MAG: phospholipase D family protein [Nanoarchaeota archaeon]
MKRNKVYLGRKAGKYLLEDLHNARKSVKIISPYLTPDYVMHLIDIKNKGVDVNLITSDCIEINDYCELSHTDIIKQKVHTLAGALQERQNLMNYAFWSTIIGIGSLFFGFFVLPMLFLFVLSLIFASVLWFLYINKQIYEYSYYSLFPLKVFFSQYSNEQYKNDFLIHSKVYIIDNRVAYIGSVNFTHSGLVNSYECISRVSDKNEVSYLNREYDKLFHNGRLKFKDIQVWGKEIYLEPRN